MPKNSTYTICLLAISLLAMGTNLSAASLQPITGPAFERWRNAQDEDLQEYLRSQFPDSDGYFVTGPLDPLFEGPQKAGYLYHSIRIICPELEMMENAYNAVVRDSAFRVSQHAAFIHEGKPDFPVGYRGALVFLTWHGQDKIVQVNTTEQTRFLVWAHDFYSGKDNTVPPERVEAYAQAVSSYLYTVERRWNIVPHIDPEAYGLVGLLDSLNFYPESPQPMLPDNGDYDAYLKRNAGIYTEFASGIKSLIPTDSLIIVIKNSAPHKAWPNRDAKIFQHQYLEYYARGGETNIIRSLTKENFDDLPSGQYLFAVGMSGQIRIARKPAEAESDSLALELGRKAPVINQAFLFPGEPVLTAGTMEIVHESPTRIAAIDVRGEPFFYSNYSDNLKNEVEIKSNEYFLTIGYLFRALDKIGIDYKGVLISKM